VKKYCILKRNHAAMPNRRTIIVIGIVFLLITLPFIAASISAGSEHVFSGFLVNPHDGNSYLAKMREGFQGAWSFTLPYSKDPGSGAFLFIFYLFLGHFARITGLTLILTFHLSRIFGFIFLFLVVYYFLRDYFGRDQEKISLTFMIVMLGSGLGWLLIPFGIKTSDLWVAEAYPFLSSFQNPHFPFGLGLMLLILLLFHRENQRYVVFILFLLGLALAIILPFGAVVIGIVILGEQILAFIRKKKVYPARVISLGLSTLPLILYQYTVVNSSPELTIWNAQNLTPSPPVWDFLIAFCPALILAGLSWKQRSQTARDDLYYALFTWLVFGAVIIYLPIGIQRRFMVGYFLPVSILASTFILSFSNRKTRVLGFTALLASTAFTLLLVLLAAFSAISGKNPLIFLSLPEAEAMRWLDKNSRGGELTLADARMGMFLPAFTSSRVIYGHPFETVNSEDRKNSVDAFFTCSFTTDEAQEYLVKNQVEFIFNSNLDFQACYPKIARDTNLVFRAGDDKIFTEIYQLP
jgi:hypothetical protein